MTIVGTGIDIVETARIADSIARHGERFLARIFTEGERQYCGSMRKPEGFYAARFAAKEAVSKAFGTGIGAQLGWLDIEVRRRASGEPFVVLHGEGAATARRLGISEVRLSLSHSEHYAVAHALTLGDPA
ncbi:MAG: holo-[acyl-carrier protein] synthase [Chthoniobacter sp.]|jgi:holo-[acyl-carrier protein] synthase|nr:holo-[acyl-carrier protein] synthase [Chthoniobacter sp.]